MPVFIPHTNWWKRWRWCAQRRRRNDLSPFFIKIAPLYSPFLGIKYSQSGCQHTDRCSNTSYSSKTILASRYWAHHEIISWDDDFDLVTSMEYRQDIQEGLRRMGPEVQYYSQGEREKVFFRPNNRSTRTSYSVGRYPWEWPSVDIGFYVIDNNLMAHEYGWWRCKFNLKDVFPITWRPIMGERRKTVPICSMSTHRRRGLNSTTLNARPPWSLSLCTEVCSEKKPYV